VIGTSDAEILISLNPEHHHPTAQYVRQLRRVLPSRFPGVEFFFQPADIVSQILNFGLPAPVDIQVVGADIRGNYDMAQRIANRLRQIPGTADVHVQQLMSLPTLYLDMDRTRINQVGLNAQNVAQNVLVSLSGSFQTSPNFWLNRRNGVSYNIAIQTPQYHMTSLQDLMNTPVTGGSSQTAPQVLGNLAQLTPVARPAVVNHYNVQPVIDVYASTQGRDLGGVASDIMKVLKPFQEHPPRGTQIVVRGQVETMRSSFFGLGVGLIGAIVLVYLLIVVNFQSWLDPFIIITALPGALAGICWFLLITRTTLSVPSLTGAVMCMGVATANSILLVSFSRDRMNAGAPARQAALEAGHTRMRPVIMTALAMIIGMVPMALGLGEGGEQNAPLGRAVIGGLLFATVATLFFVPSVFTMIHGRREAREVGAEVEKKKRSRDFFGDRNHAVQPPVTAEQNETEAVRPDEYQPSDVGPKPAGRAKLLIVAVLLVLITAGAVTFLNRKSETDALAKETEAVSIPTVAVVQPQAEPGNDELVLPGNLQAFIESPIFARTNGYLLRWYKDMGSKVEKGELLAAIDTPEVDQELSQARASREQIKAALGLAKISADRWANLLKTDSVSQQEADQQASGYQQALANLRRRMRMFAAWRTRVFQERLRSVFRRADPAQCRSGRAHQFRGASGGQRAVRYRARRPASRLRECSASVCAEHQGWDEGQRHPAGISRPEICGHGGSHRRCHRSRDPHSEHGSGCSQQGWQAAARFVRPGAFCDRDFCSQDYDPGQRHAVPRRGTAGRGRRQGRQGAFAPDQHWTRLRRYA
jgi:hypothetical protein